MRADALAKLYLTRRSDLDVLTISGSNSRADYDLLVRVNGVSTTTTPEFGVEAKGISQPLSSGRWRSSLLRNLVQAEHHDVVRSTGQNLPVCLFVFNIDSEDGLYMWLREPIVEHNGRPRAVLALNLHWSNDGQRRRVSSNAPFEKLDGAALDHIVERVVQWYRARDKLLRLSDDLIDRGMSPWGKP